MRVLRSQYLKHQQCITTTTTTTLAALKVQPKIVGEGTDAVETASVAGIAPVADTIAASSTTTHSTTQVTATRLLPIAGRRKTYDVPEQEDIENHLGSLQQPTLIKERRKTVAHCSNLSTLTLHTVTERGSMQINLLNVHKATNLTHLKLVFEFSDPGLNWYSELYRSYENDLWKRIPRARPTKKYKWRHQCLLCKNSLSTFQAINAHLNIHMGWAPHHCAACHKKYPSRKSLVRHHHKTSHQMKIALKKQMKKSLL